MHESHERHRRYRLSCDQFDEVVARGGSRCEICGIPAKQTWRRTLVIDHAADVGVWAVRGLLCPPCNTAIGADTAFSEQAANYLAAPWYAQMIAAAGYPDGARPEPPVGARVRDAIRGRWERRDAGWYPISGYYKTAETWEWLLRMFGPHLLQLIDEHL